MEQANTTILIVEDDLDIADMLNAYFRVQGYEVLTVNWGEDGVRACQTNMPDLVILDIRLPDIDGFEVARRLRANRRTKQIPIIFLTEKRERVDRLKGLQLNAEDYITKPFDIQELRLRVRNALQRAQRSTLTNPVTSIPEGNMVDEQLNGCLERSDWGMLVISLKNLDRFREMYGFVASDDLLRAISLMLEDGVNEYGNQEDFIGHLSATDFVVISRPTNLNELKTSIQKRLDQSFDYFYRDQDKNSDAFRAHRLGLHISELLPSSSLPKDIERFRSYLEQLYRQNTP
ncbi:MAG TPA: response regulator [Anaerolineaceae bacterium]|nr:response regulator [Anaerolineaceae bacterium]